MEKQKLRIIGVTGGIASGKSSIAQFFADRGIPVIDADQLSRDAVKADSDCLKRIVTLFGDDILAKDGALNRNYLKQLVFADLEKKKLLEQIIHPEIKRLAEEQIVSAVSTGHQLIIYMAPLLIEAGATDRVTEIWLVSVKPGLQLERLMKRDAIDKETAKRIIDSQMPLAEKERYARIVIDNSGTLEDTKELLEKIWQQEIKAYDH